MTREREMKGFLLFLFMVFCLVSQLYGMSFEEKVSELGLEDYTVKESKCSTWYCKPVVPYSHEKDYQYINFWDSPSTKIRKQTGNAVLRNKYLLASGNFPSKSQDAVNRIDKNLTLSLKIIEKHNKEFLNFKKKEKESRKQAFQLHERAVVLQKLREEGQVKISKIREDNFNIAGGNLSIGESLIFGSDSLGYSQRDKQDLTQIKKIQKEVKTTIIQINKMKRESDKKFKQADDYFEQKKLSLKKFNMEKKASLKKLVALKQKQQALESDNKKTTSSLNQNTERIKTEQAILYANAKIKELKKDEKFAEFLMRDYKSLQQDLRLDGLSADALIEKSNNRIQASLLGQYIQDKLAEASSENLEKACNSAKSCISDNSLVDSSRQVVQGLLPASDAKKSSKKSTTDVSAQ